MREKGREREREREQRVIASGAEKIWRDQEIWDKKMIVICIVIFKIHLSKKINK